MGSEMCIRDRAYVLVLFHMAYKQDANGPQASPLANTLKEQAE